MFGFESSVSRGLTASDESEVKTLVERCGLKYEPGSDLTVMVRDSDDKLAATASLKGHVAKMVAVDPSVGESGLASFAISRLLEESRISGITHLFVFTKRETATHFASLGFREIASAEDASLLEIGAPNIEAYRRYLIENKLPCDRGLMIGAMVVNCNPFTLGHRYLVEHASRECDYLYVIVVQEDASVFRFADRIELVKLGTADLQNVRVIASGEYAISAATFPTYFLKDRGELELVDVQASLDANLFARLFAAELHIRRRFVGTEPNCRVTARYNEMLKKNLPPRGVELVEIPRVNGPDGLPISASTVRELLGKGNFDAIARLVPPTTLDFLKGSRGH